MSEETKKAPAIRFQGFTDDWEQRKLGDDKDVRDGTHDSPKYHQEGHPLVTSKNLNDYGLDMTDVSLISDADFEAINKRSKVDNGDILFGMIGTIGNPVIVDRSDFAIKNVALIKEGGDIPNRFLIQLLKSSVFEKYIRNENAGNTQKFLGLSKIREFTFFTPTTEEQIRIATFFKQLDDTIALHQRQLDNYKQLKKSMKQKIFDQKLRFKDADGNDYPKWKRRTLGEISEIIMGQSPDSANYTSNEQDTVLIQGNADLNGGRITPRIYTTQITKTCEAGDIILTVRAPVGDLAIANTRACIGRGVCAIKGDLYIYQYLEMIRDTDGWRKIIQGSTFESINSNDVKDLPIDVPSSEERKKIAEFFKALDRRIEKSTQRVESMKQFRKGLMQQMFVE